MVYEIIIDGNKRRLELDRRSDEWECVLDGHEIPIDMVSTHADVLSLLIDGKTYEVKRERSASSQNIWIGNTCYQAEVRDPRSLRGRNRAAGDDDGPKKLMAAMAGKVVRVLVAEKDEVDAGQGIIVVEAMKMQNEIKSPKKGVIQKVLVAQGGNVNAGDVLAVVE
ncbi:MAG: biotin carboxyl carrier protein [Acidobacteriaceae bacterium]|jgi:biotin carboxyl carrier protein|nr:biotin carboxyl carrier protein [Acidobacteriaceae bacterium]